MAPVPLQHNPSPSFSHILKAVSYIPRVIRCLKNSDGAMDRRTYKDRMGSRMWDYNFKLYHWTLVVTLKFLRPPFDIFCIFYSAYACLYTLLSALIIVWNHQRMFGHFLCHSCTLFCCLWSFSILYIKGTCFCTLEHLFILFVNVWTCFQTFVVVVHVYARVFHIIIRLWLV